MINKWKLFNFKSVRDETMIELKPLTILAGANSSGKSTVLQSMLLIAQTLYSRVSSKSVILNGTLTRLGQFDDLRSFGSEATQILIGWELSTNYQALRESVQILRSAEKLETIICDISFEADPSRGESNISQLHPRLFSCQITATGEGHKVWLSASRHSLFEASSLQKKYNVIDEEGFFYDDFTHALDYRFEIDNESLAESLEELPTKTELIGCSFQHFLPDGLTFLTKLEEESRFVESSGLYFDQMVIPDVLKGNLKGAVEYIQDLFIRQLKYLGPLRDEPKSLYPLTPSADPNDVGLRGEYTAAVLDLHKADQVQYIPTTSFEDAQVPSGKSVRTLESAVTDWLVYLGVAESVKTIDRGKIGHEMKVIMPGSKMEHDLTHVGVGVSQVLPILVMCLLAEPGSVILIEQPELHLHPKVQTRLADFFLSMSMLGKQCIIETHSEYIVNRLRFRAAAAQADSISSLMKIYFVDKIEGCSVFRPVEVNKYGAITDWPDGFFDQSQSEAEEILRAATMKRKAEKGK
jgi:predicted ATPase